MRHGLSLLILILVAPLRAEDRPTVLDPRLTLELIAEQPEIVTPTGIAVDARDRIFVIENNTHQRPPQYKGPPTDRIRIFEDFDDAGRARKITTFAEGFKDSMSLSFGPDGVLYLATRSAIYRFPNGKKDAIVRLVTKGDYPHNGLCGFAWGPRDELYFGLGENLGEAYKVAGSDGRALEGGGEGGSVYRCRGDGSLVERVATGFWNPFGMTFDAFGRLFVVDNDPDARGPCRLLHIVDGGDYGYRFRYGRKGTHPFQSWNGELPGTLPMVAGTGEAPSGILAYESDNLPQEYVGKLFVTSWGDHVIEYFDVKPKGASFTATSKILVRGGENFRPVGIVQAPDGSIIFSDWVDKSYPVHGKGRIWRLRSKQPPAGQPANLAAVEKLPPEKLRPFLSHPRREVRSAAARQLAESPAGMDLLFDAFKNGNDVRERLEALWAATRTRNDSWYVRDLLACANVKDDPAIRAELIEAAQRCRYYEKDSDAFDFRNSAIISAFEHDPAPYVRMHLYLPLLYHSRSPIGFSTDETDPFLLTALLKMAVIVTPSPPREPDYYGPAISRLNDLLYVRKYKYRGFFKVDLTRYLNDPDPGVRRAAIQWVAEERLKEYADKLEATASQSPITRELFEAWLAARELLDGKKAGDPNKEIAGEEYVAGILKDEKQPVLFRTLALRMLRPDHPVLTVGLLSSMLQQPNEALRREVVRTLILRPDPQSQSLLRRLASDQSLPMPQRALAITGLAHSANSAETQNVLLAAVKHAELKAEAQRAKGEVNAEVKRTPEEWRTLLTSENGDALAGERVFFQPKGPGCYKCHRIDGRGANVGPDLSSVGKALSRDKLIESILEPSKEIAPAYTSWRIVTRDGKDRVGMIVAETFDSFVAVADSQGKIERIPRAEIEERTAVPKSIMPDELANQMTRREFLDLLAYLLERK
jgi:putative membrane-bound dehydrogenase-like protein